ncbi:GNAT family N-acetyltransferase [Thermoflavimicrobium daqui]|uniref:N-acetyltransferase domain-containing protein n=1 Tax=Thermoflavimicrobium daqui TaxID=2137476 RepID=A0A364K3J3_9BACL|nr:hypothetical protein [Thermoflavimicrobium daqui]RAL23328.1 hypothetical protein DL897_11580 [Thermoflavimicrobium daqui]
MFLIRRAQISDLYSVKRLLQQAKLNDQGIDQHLEHFFIVEQTDEEEETGLVVGAIGMEVYNPYGLLRSFVLARASWNGKVGIHLIKILLAYAEALKLFEVYLVAGDSISLFQLMGFEVIDYENLPDEISDSNHVKRCKEQKGTPMVYKCFTKRKH